MRWLAYQRGAPAGTALVRRRRPKWGSFQFRAESRGGKGRVQMGSPQPPARGTGDASSRVRRPHPPVTKWAMEIASRSAQQARKGVDRRGGAWCPWIPKHRTGPGEERAQGPGLHPLRFRALTRAQTEHTSCHSGGLPDSGELRGPAFQT